MAAWAFSNIGSSSCLEADWRARVSGVKVASGDGVRAAALE